MKKNHDTSYNWYDICDCYSKYSSVESNLIYESDNIVCDRFKITIAIPTYRRSNLLARALKSALKQKRNRLMYDYEIIVVDNDNEIDLATDRLMRYFCKNHENIRYYRNEKNIGMTGNWNRCIELSAGKWVVLLHDDDILMSSYLKNVLPWAERSDCSVMGVFHINKYDDAFHSEINKKYGKNLMICSNILRFLRWNRPFELRPTDIYANIYPSPVCAIFRKDKAVELGGFPEKINSQAAHDAKGFVKQIYHGKVLILPQILAFRGVGVNESLNIDLQRKMITEKYRFAMHVLEKDRPRFKKYRKWCADLSARYMVESIHGHFNAEADFDELLRELKIDSTIVHMSPKVVTIFKYVPLLSLIFRRKY